MVGFVSPLRTSTEFFSWHRQPWNNTKIPYLCTTVNILVTNKPQWKWQNVLLKRLVIYISYFRTWRLLLPNLTTIKAAYFLTLSKKLFLLFHNFAKVLLLCCITVWTSVYTLEGSLLHFKINNNTQPTTHLLQRYLRQAYIEDQELG